MAKNLNNRLKELEQSREEDYGSFNRNMKKIAAAWSILLDPYLKQDIPAHLIPLLYAQAKLVRATHKFKEDTYDDALAYIVQSHHSFVKNLFYLLKKTLQRFRLLHLIHKERFLLFPVL